MYHQQRMQVSLITIYTFSDVIAIFLVGADNSAYVMSLLHNPVLHQSTEKNLKTRKYSKPTNIFLNAIIYSFSQRMEN